MKMKSLILFVAGMMWVFEGALVVDAVAALDSMAFLIWLLAIRHGLYLYLDMFPVSHKLGDHVHELYVGFQTFVPILGLWPMIAWFWVHGAVASNIFRAVVILESVGCLMILPAWLMVYGIHMNAVVEKYVGQPPVWKWHITEQHAYQCTWVCGLFMLFVESLMLVQCYRTFPLYNAMPTLMFLWWQMVTILETFFRLLWFPDNRTANIQRLLHVRSRSYVVPWLICTLFNGHSTVVSVGLFIEEVMSLSLVMTELQIGNVRVTKAEIEPIVQHSNTYNTLVDV